MENPREWIRNNETAEQMFCRINIERPALFLPPLNRTCFRAGDVVEITGPSSSAKSEILLQAAINCILPNEWNGVRFGGLERVVAYIDLDCRFDVLRLAQVLKLRIMSAYGPAHGTHRDLYEVSSKKSLMISQADHLEDELFLSCMKRFLYIRCYNSSEFLNALKTAQLGSKSSSEGLVSLYVLIIDSIGAFHWNDRVCQTLVKDGNTREKLTEIIVQEINKIRDVQPLLVLASKATIFGVEDPTNDAHRGHFRCSKNMNKQDRKKLLYREYMPPVWQLFVTHKLFLEISVVVSSDGRNGESPTYVCEWIHPCCNASDKFVVNASEKFLVRNAGIFRPGQPMSEVDPQPSRRQQQTRTAHTKTDYGPPPLEVHLSIRNLRNAHRAAHTDSGTKLEAASHLLMARE